jgi:hypothetical protein
MVKIQNAFGIIERGMVAAEYPCYGFALGRGLCVALRYSDLPMLQLLRPKVLR